MPSRLQRPPPPLPLRRIPGHAPGRKAGTFSRLVRNWSPIRIILPSGPMSLPAAGEASMRPRLGPGRRDTSSVYWIPRPADALFSISEPAYCRKLLSESEGFTNSVAFAFSIWTERRMCIPHSGIMLAMPLS
ncbi:hypothetical protein ACFLSA_04535 [Bacteroidota bacterium]